MYLVKEKSSVIAFCMNWTDGMAVVNNANGTPRKLEKTEEGSTISITPERKRRGN